tara:strand:- start:2092 stop:3963 length:1872 start_codon:yes stop_codon:yes gene_type:complete
MSIVTIQQFHSRIDQFKLDGHYGLDTETFGIGRQDRLYSIILSNEKTSYYFNFLSEQDHLGNEPAIVLPKEFIKEFEPVFNNANSTWYIHNAKFDMAKLGMEGLKIKGTVHCTQALARLVKNNHLSYSLDACVKRIYGYNIGKLSLDEYITKHKLHETVEIPGKQKRQKNKFYHKVPFDIMADYGIRDGRVVQALGEYQERKLTETGINKRLIQTERNLTKVCFDIEQRGIKLDMQYVRKGMADQEEKLVQAKEDFQQLTGIEYKRGPTCLVEAFTAQGIPIRRTAKGRPSFSKDALLDSDYPIVHILKRIRSHEKIIDTYYSSFLHLSDPRGIIRANIFQSGTETGRFSYSSPNLQNLPKEDNVKKDYYVRKCFVPRKDHCFVMIDYDQQEYRLMLDYAGEFKLIDRINQGLDVHQATADLLNSASRYSDVTRKTAKMINFMLLYGGGTETLAKQLDVTLDKAKELRRLYFESLPRVTDFFRRVVSTAKSRGWIQNWAGRKCYLSSLKGAYIMPNHLIQGGCADIIKSAMTKIHKLLKGKKSSMLVQIHDELLLEMHESELSLVPRIKQIMEDVYTPKNGLKLTCGVEHSWVSFASIDKIKGLPCGQETRDSFQREIPTQVG